MRGQLAPDSFLDWYAKDVLDVHKSVCKNQFVRAWLLLQMKSDGLHQRIIFVGRFNNNGFNFP